MNSKTLANAAQALEKAQAQAAQISEALAQYDGSGNLDELRTDLERLKAEQEDLAAAAALGELPAGDAKRSQQAIDAAQAAIAAAEKAANEGAAVAAGLRRRLASAEAAAAKAAAEMEAAEVAYLRELATEADREYTEHARAAWSAWTRIAAARAALGSRGHPLDSMGTAIQAPELRAAGPHSEKAAREVFPMEPHGWATLMTPRHEAGAGRAVIEAELSAAKAAPAGLVSRAVQAVRKATA